jgi:hypothetical protein
MMRREHHLHLDTRGLRERMTYERRADTIHKMNTDEEEMERAS